LAKLFTGLWYEGRGNNNLIGAVDDRHRLPRNLTENEDLLVYDCILARLGKHLIRDNVTFCIPSLTCERAGQMHYKGKMGTRAHTHTHTGKIAGPMQTNAVQSNN